MDTPPSNIKKVSIPVEIQIPESLNEAVTLESFRKQIKQDLQSVLDALGIPAESTVDFTPLTPDLDDYVWLKLSIDGINCLYPRDLLRQPYEFIANAHLEHGAGSDEILSRLSNQSFEQIQQFISLVCKEVIQKSSSSLLNSSICESYHQSLVKNFDILTLLSDVKHLQNLLSQVISLHISLASQEKVAQVLQEGLSKAKPTDAIAEDLITSLRPDVMEVQMPYDYLKQLTQNSVGNDHEVFALMRDGLFYELGVRYPEIKFVPTEDLEPGSFRFKINHLTTLPYRGLAPEQRLVSDTPDRLGLLGITGSHCVNPANGNLCAIIDTAQETLAKDAGLTTWTPMGYLILALSRQLRTNAYCFIDQNTVNAELTTLEQVFPKLISVVRNQIPLAGITRSLRLLLTEEISIRNLRAILQAILDFDYIITDDAQYIIFDPRLTTLSTPSDDWLHDPENLVAFIRTTMKSYISHKYTRGQSSLVVYLLDPEIEKLLTKKPPIAIQSSGSDTQYRDQYQILSALRSEVYSLSVSTTVPAILTTTSVRKAFRRVVSQEFPDLPILAYQELSPEMNIQPIARITPGIGRKSSGAM